MKVKPSTSWGTLNVGAMSIQRGVVYIALGSAAEYSVRMSISTLRQYYSGPIEVWSDRVMSISGARQRYMSIPYSDNVRGSRYCKVNLVDVSPFTSTLYIDADTLIRGSIDIGFQILEDGYDMVLCASHSQGPDAMHHIAEDERWYTLCMLYGSALQLQAGVMFVRKSQQITDLFWAWRNEWRVWHNQDQAALMRALYKCPVRVWLLGRPWNGGAVIEHRFGRAR